MYHSSDHDRIASTSSEFCVSRYNGVAVPETMVFGVRGNSQVCRYDNTIVNHWISPDIRCIAMDVSSSSEE